MNQKVPIPSQAIEAVKLMVGVRIAGEWHYRDFDSSAVPLPPIGNVTPMRRMSDLPPLPGTPPPPARHIPMTMGRDPAKFLITIGKKFQGRTIEEADAEFGKLELCEFAEWGRKQPEPSPSLEVLCEMIEAYLIEREYVPPQKYNTPRRRA